MTRTDHMAAVVAARINGISRAIMPGCPDSLWRALGRLRRIETYLWRRAARTR